MSQDVSPIGNNFSYQKVKSQKYRNPINIKNGKFLIIWKNQKLKQYSIFVVSIKLFSNVSRYLYPLQTNKCGRVRLILICKFTSTLCLLDFNYARGSLIGSVDATAGGRFVPEGNTSLVVNTSVLT